ncbi:poly-gamma-glutamate synthase PgsB [Numidum massiliense]|uniref:poly-gamma-glutamate synthase PgsB n=1 Tax=Numidum massiliense TaxID=1522315 RepID=UPI0006D54C66|nr:poly-gamma-glutamate synthase PgsB [Numidum massiliense]
MWLIPLACAVILVAGIVEWRQHQKHINAIPIRVNVNGIRGKSTVTRLITGILTEAKYKTVGKTTGTAARMIYSFQDEEEPIKRRPEGPNISEQKRVVQKAAKLDADALVSECMAVTPDYQIVFQERMLRGNIGVIVNVLEDHMDVMGPTLDEIAEAFTATIPYNGRLVISEGPYVDYFKRVARDRNTKVTVVKPGTVSDDFLKKFEYMVFPENAALALGVARALGIKKEVALQGMLNAHPDPGALRILPLGNPDEPAYFVNAFAANDAASTLNIWDRVVSLGYPKEKPVVIMNCREDRVDRSEQFAEDVLPHLPIDTLVLIGETTDPIKRAYESGKIKANEVLDLNAQSVDKIIEAIQGAFADRVLFGVGNIHGAAEPLIEKLHELKLKQRVS